MSARTTTGIATGIALTLLLAPTTARAQEETAPPAASPPPRQVAEVPLPFELPEIPPGDPLPLDEALERTAERNLSLAATRTELDRAEAELYRAWAVLLPNASGTMTLTHRDQEDAASMGGQRITITNQDSLSGRIDVSMPIVHPQAWAGIRAGRTGERVAELTVENARQTLLTTVARAHYQALTAMRLIEVNEGQLRSAARHLEVARTRHVSGVGARLDVLRAEGELVRAREALVTAHASLTNARDALGILTGTGGLPLPVEGDELTPPDGDADALEQAASDRREDLRLRRTMTALAEQQLNVSWMQFLPSLNASWQLTHQFTDPSGFGSTDRTRWTAYLNLSVPIYNQTRYADLDKGRAAVRKAELEAADAEQQARLEVRSARRDYLTALEKIAVATEQAEIAGETLLLTESQYVSGTGSSLAVTDARRGAREAQINLAMRRFEAQLALLDLLRAAGEDMQSLASP